MDIQNLQFLFDYNYWARDILLDQAAKLSPQQFTEPKIYAHGSLRNTLVHILSAEWVWRTRFQERISPMSLLRFDDFPTLEPLQQRWRQEEERMRSYLSGLSPQELDGVVQYQRTSGEPRENILWHLLVHVVNHGTEHRSIVAEMLTAYGYSPGNMDINNFLQAVG